MPSSMKSSWTFINASSPTLPVPTSAANRSNMEAYLQRLAHLDGLYNDFYGLWVTLIVINCLIFLVSMVLNTVALYVFCLRTNPKTTSVIYTINLAVTNLKVNLSLPTRILLYYSGGACLTCSYMHIFCYFVNMYCSIVFLTCICVDRYLVIVQVEASRHWRNSSVAKCVWISVWLFAIVVTYSSLSTAFQNTGCCIAKLLILTITEFFLPYIIILVFTLRIMWALIDWRLMKQNRERRHKAIQLLATVLVIFTICFTPFHVRQVRKKNYMPHNVIVYHLTVTLSSLNSCMDPIVYCFVTNNFLATVRHLFQRVKAEQTSGEIVSMHANTNNVMVMMKITGAVQRDN
uniref:G protein-coupled receptor 20 n=1 Tax=Oryzias latipes TaxID=8090 RepID=A0A3P9M8M7_ORYLA